MHEWALAESILSAAIETAEKEKLKKITEIKITIGELQQIEQDIFEFALDQIIKDRDKKIKNVKIKIKSEKSTLKCKNCEKVWSFLDMKKKLSKDESESIHFIPEVVLVHSRCPACGSPDFEILTGRGVTITTIKGEK
jgi:hydrogenase nickel incorporation protein HypA/HybF